MAANRAVAPPGGAPDSDRGGGVVLAGLTLLWAPTAIILVSFGGLLQFRMMFAALASLFSVRQGGIVWRKVQPVMSDFIGSMEASLGPASKFTPSLTHILLVGVILAIFIASERSRRH